jgi:hypothetical protein
MDKKLLKIWSWDPGSEIRDPEKTYFGSRIPDPGVKKHPIPDPGSGSATLSVIRDKHPGSATLPMTFAKNFNTTGIPK